MAGDHAAIGRAMGLAGRRAGTAAELVAALEDSFATDAPALIDVTVDPTGYRYVLDVIRGRRD